MINEVNDCVAFGERLAYARKKKGLTQKQLAELIGVTCTWLSKCEEGRRKPNVLTIRKISTALKVSENWLIKNNGDFPRDMQLTKEQQQLVADNEKVIGAVFQRFSRQYNPTCESYDDLYGDAAINLCRAAKLFDKQHGKKDKFFVFAFVCVKWAVLNSYMKKEKYLHRTTSLNKIIGHDDHGTDVELGEIIPSPDKWEQLEYKILADSVYQKVEPVLGDKEKEAFRLYLLGNENPKIAIALGIPQHTSLCRIWRAKKKCRAAFNPDEIFA